MKKTINALITKYQNIENNSGYDPEDSAFDQGDNAGSSRVAFEIIEDLKQLKQSLQQTKPAPVVVPEFVAKWYELHKRDLEQAIFDLHVDLYKKRASKRSEFENWANHGENHPIETLIRMKDGYTVEKEPLYYVIFAKNTGDWRYTFLERDGYVEHTDELSYLVPFTEKQIKEIDERLWSYAVPVEEEGEK